MKVTISFFLILFGSLVLLSSCKKYEGPGGKASITGTVIGKKYDGAGNLLASYALMKHDVFIIYGNDTDNTIFNDDTKSSYDGKFKFDKLVKGTYRIFTYSKCPTCASGDTTLLYTVEISDKKGEVDLGIIEVRD